MRLLCNSMFFLKVFVFFTLIVVNLLFGDTGIISIITNVVVLYIIFIEMRLYEIFNKSWYWLMMFTALAILVLTSNIFAKLFILTCAMVFCFMQNKKSNIN